MLCIEVKKAASSCCSSKSLRSPATRRSISACEKVAGAFAPFSIFRVSSMDLTSLSDASAFRRHGWEVKLF